MARRKNAMAAGGAAASFLFKFPSGSLSNLLPANLRPVQPLEKFRPRGHFFDRVGTS